MLCLRHNKSDKWYAQVMSPFPKPKENLYPETSVSKLNWSSTLLSHGIMLDFLNNLTLTYVL